MKEAAGEANMTVVTIVLIAIVLGAGTLIVTNIVRGMKNNKSTKCAEVGGALDSNGNCIPSTPGDCPSGQHWSESNSRCESCPKGKYWNDYFKYCSASADIR